MIKKIIVLFALIWFTNSACLAQSRGFVDDLYSDEFQSPVGLTFAADGRMFVWEKSGKVYEVSRKSKERKLLLDISEEVYDYLDHGLNGLALDPHFLENGLIYLLYAVDRNYLFFRDSANYDPKKNDQLSATIARVTRYTLKNSLLDPASRKVILGSDHRNAIPILMDNHGIGTLAFGADGSLLVSVGDVAVVKDPPFQDGDPFWWEMAVLPVKEGIISEDQNIGPYRSQYLNSLNGKILRINPETGDGYSSNPFYDQANPCSPRSRIWAYGLRNPFRFIVKPGTGVQDLAAGNPGKLILGDVGWANREEINMVDSGGMNFGWPRFEGNSFENIILSNNSFMPKNPVSPKVEWRGDVAQTIINGEAFAVGSPEFKGETFSGNSSIGGIWLTYDHFKGFKDSYLHGDNSGWLKIFKFDFRDNIYEVVSVIDNVHPVCMAEDPTDGSVYYANYFYPDIHEIRHIYNEANPNTPPFVQAKVEPIYGASPLRVNFDASGSFDPDGSTTSTSWKFNNGNAIVGAVQSTTYYSDKQETYYPIATVTDNLGKSTIKKFRVYINNYPAEIISTSIDHINTFINDEGLAMKLDAKIKNHDAKEELYYEWSVILHHEDHSHLITSVKTRQFEAVLLPVPCDGQKYHYEIKLFVHDETGLGSTFSKLINPLCKGDIPLGLELNPNPIENQINLKGKDLFDGTELSYQLFDIHGRLQSRKSGVWKHLKSSLNKEAETFVAGVYILRIVIGKKSQAFRFVKI